MPTDESSQSEWPVDLDHFSAPVRLVRRGQGAPARPGVYLVNCGDCIPHIGTSNRLQSRIHTLASLGNHRGSAEVLCAAYCTSTWPMVRWCEMDIGSAHELELRLKAALGEPPQPRHRYESCVNGGALRRAMVTADGENTWVSGYIDALFEVGEQLRRLFTSRFDADWSAVGVPPGPWDSQEQQ